MAAATAACGESITSAFRTTAARPPYLDGPVTVSMAREPAGRTTLAIVQVQSDRTDIDRLLPALQGEAAWLGCNAILHVRIHDGQATGMAVRIPRSRPASGD